MNLPFEKLQKWEKLSTGKAKLNADVAVLKT